MLAALLFVACGPTTSDQVVGSYKFTTEWDEPGTEKSFPHKITIDETEIFEEDKSYTEEGMKSVTYFIDDEGRELSTTLYFSYVRTGTWKIEYTDGREWLVINGLTDESRFEKYELSEEDPALEAWSKQLGEDIVADMNSDDDWKSEHNYGFIGVNDETLTYETKTETIRVQRIK